MNETMISQYLNVARHNTAIASNVLTSPEPESRRAQASSTRDPKMRSSATRELYLTKYFFYQHQAAEMAATPTTSTLTSTATNTTATNSESYDNATADAIEDDYQRDCDNENILYEIKRVDYRQPEELDGDENNQKNCINDEDNCNAVEEPRQVEGAGVWRLRQSNLRRNDKLERARTINADYNNEKRQEYGDKVTGLTTGCFAVDCNKERNQELKPKLRQRQNLVTCVSCKNGRQRQQQVSVNTNSITNFRSAISMENNATSSANNSANIANSDNLSPISSDSATTNSPSNSVSKQHQQLVANCGEPSGTAASISRCSTQISSSSNTNLASDHHQSQPQQQQYHQNQPYLQQFVYNNHQYISCRPGCEKGRSLRSTSLNRRRNSSPNFDSSQQSYLYPQRKPQLSIEQQLRRLLEIDPTVCDQDQTKTATEEEKFKTISRGETNKTASKSCLEANALIWTQNKSNIDKIGQTVLTGHIRDSTLDRQACWADMKKSSAGNAGKLGASGRADTQNDSPFGGSSRARSQPNISPDDRLMIFMLASRSTNTNSTVERNARILKWLNNCKSAG